MATTISEPQVVKVRFGKKELEEFTVDELNTHFKVNTIPKGEIKCSVTGDTSKVNNDLQICQAGEKVTIHITEGNKEQLIFSGIVMRQTFNRKPDGATLTLTLLHVLTRLAGTQRSQVFQDVDDKGIINKILKEYKFDEKYDTQLSGSGKHEQMVQCNTSDWSFIMSRIHANGAWLMPTPESIIINEPILSSKPKFTLEADKTGDGVGIQDAVWHFGHAELAKKQSISFWDIKNQKQQESKATSPNIWKGEGYNLSKIEPLSPLSRIDENTTSFSNEESKALASQQLLTQYATGVQVSLTLTGSKETAKYRLGQTLKLSGFNKQCDGNGLISEIYHRFYNNRWDTKVGIGLPRSNSDSTSSTAHGVYIGIVDKLPAEKDSLFRLRVTIPAMDNISLWARFSTPYASENSGICFYPEVGDEVVLSFFGQNPNYPVIQGAMHNPKRKPPISPSKENDIKLLLLGKKKELGIVFDTKEDSVRIGNSTGYLSSNKEGAELSTSKEMSISGKKGVDIKSKKIDLKK